MIDFDYINDLIGVPFLDNGRTLNGLDCYGLVLEVSETQFNNHLPDWRTNHTAANVAKQISSGIESVVMKGKAFKFDKPLDGDIAVVARKETPYHMGIVLAGGILHTTRETGVLFQPIAAFTHGQGKTEFYRWVT